MTVSGNLLGAIGRWVINLWRPPLEFFSDAVAVIRQSCRPVTWRRPVRSKFVNQCYEIGTRALPFIMVSGIFGGFGIVAQSLYWLEAFGGKALFGGFLTVVLMRETAPVLVSLIVIGRSGAAILVELGTMRADGQVRALDAQGIDPFLYLVLPRVLAFSLSMFCLTVAFVVVALVAGFISGTLIGMINLPFMDFLHSALGAMGSKAYFLMTAKTLGIGFVVGLISCKTALSEVDRATDVLDALPRSYARSVLATLLISILLSIVF
jgi:phospholipid/cholesterol/gamma-HCH transport system permease protein